MDRRRHFDPFGKQFESTLSLIFLRILFNLMQTNMPADFIMQSCFRFNCVEIDEHNIENTKLNFEYFIQRETSKIIHFDRK